MNSILKTFNASAKYQAKMVGLLCILLTSCGGQDTTNPREHDITPPQIVISVNATPVSENLINIGRYDSQHHLFTTYSGLDLIIQTNTTNLIKYNGGKDEDDVVIDGVVVGFRKPLNHVPTNFTNEPRIDYENYKYIPETIIFHQITTDYTDDGASARDLWDIDYLVDQDPSTAAIDPVKTLGLDMIDVDVKGTYTITYQAEDTSGNEAIAYRKVIVDDFLLPVVTLNDSSVIAVEANSQFVEPGATATDVYDSLGKPEPASLDVEVSYTLNGELKATVMTDSPGTYIATYTATDNAGNTATATREIVVLQGFNDEVVVFRNSVFGTDFGNGIYAFDEALDWGAVNNSGDAPSINWEMVNVPDRGDVIQVTHANDNMGAGIFIQSTDEKAINLLGSKDGGIVQFDIKIISGDPNITIKAGCGYPCGAGPRDIGAQTNDWKTYRYPVVNLLPGGADGSTGLELGSVTTGLEIWATGQRATVFQIDNISWQCVEDCEGEEFIPDFTPWDKVDITNGYDAPPTSYDGYDLFWSDEFTGSEVDTNKWGFDLGNGAEQGNVGWGNSELQYYRPENATVADGMLTINAEYHQPRLEEVNGIPVPAGVKYTSAKLLTKGKFSFQYGRVDIRAVVAEGKGLWSAGWMLGDNHSTIGWPRSGEIDIVDTIGGPGQEDMIVNNMYWNPEGPSQPANGKANINDSGYGEVLASEISDIEGETFSNTFHVFSIIWTEDRVDFYVDGQLTTEMPLNGSLKDTFTQSPFYLILNVAIGGTWPGAPVFEDTDTPTQFPRGMLVDYVRVYKPTAL
ncbi:family 16 glycosylhydrolase [Porticoccaceae bacterium]|nr:family 16 glycosylhydrolase [Porticoccaceae bacterium]